VGAQNHDHGCGFWKVVNQFVANTNLHPTSSDSGLLVAEITSHRWVQ
jgi:hypothetical protein